MKSLKLSSNGESVDLGGKTQILTQMLHPCLQLNTVT
jgi:hypothetical protein